VCVRVCVCVCACACVCTCVLQICALQQKRLSTFQHNLEETRQSLKDGKFALALQLAQSLIQQASESLELQKMSIYALIGLRKCDKALAICKYSVCVCVCVCTCVCVCVCVCRVCVAERVRERQRERDRQRWNKQHKSDDVCDMCVCVCVCVCDD